MLSTLRGAVWRGVFQGGVSRDRAVRSPFYVMQLCKIAQLHLHDVRHSAILHYVNQSAITDAPPPTSVSHRESKREKTRLSLIRHARRLTAERGLGGFTIDELCTQVGVSRRTFFNYFASKDDAVIGAALGESWATYATDFCNTSTHPRLLDALTALLTQTMRTMLRDEHTPQHMMELFVSEPSLFARMKELTNQRHRELAALIREREGLDDGDGFAEVIAETLSHVAVHTFFEFTHRSCETGVALHEASPDLHMAVFEEAFRTKLTYLSRLFQQ